MLTNRDIYDHYAAVIEATKQKVSSTDVRLRLARAAVRLKVAVEEIETARLGLVADHDVGPAAQSEATEKVGERERLSAPFLRKLDDFNKAWRDLLATPSDWKSPVSIAADAFGEKDGVTAEQLAALMALGIVREPEDKPE